MNKAIYKALERQRELINNAKNNDRDLTADERAEYESLNIIINAMKRDEGSNNNETSSEGDGDGNEPPTGGARGADNGSYTPAEAAAITQLYRDFGYEDAAQTALERGLTIDAARAEIMGRMIKDKTPLASRITDDNDNVEKSYRAAVTDGLLMRGGIDVESPTDDAHRFAGMSIRDIAIDCLERCHDGSHRNYRRMSDTEILRIVTSQFNDENNTRDYYNPSAAFPSIIDDVVQKTYTDTMRRATAKFDRWVKFGTLNNFKKSPNHEYIASFAGELEKVGANGELKQYIPQDIALPERKLETYGRQFTMDRQAFINDDIGVLTTLPKRIAEMSARTQNRQIYDILLNKTKLHDSKALFDKSRKNVLTTGTNVSWEMINKMIFMLQRMVDSAGNQLDLIPDLFIVPLGMGTPLKIALRSATVNYDGNINAVNTLNDLDPIIIEDVYLNIAAGEGNPVPWFVGKAKEIIQVDYLNGQKEPTMRRVDKPGVLGFTWDVYHDWGISVRTPQAIVCNPGIVIDSEVE